MALSAVVKAGPKAGGSGGGVYEGCRRIYHSRLNSSEQGQQTTTGRDRNEHDTTTATTTSQLAYGTAAGNN
jgi:hypothetical protein